jgi:alpha-tubulin suppressor-like RCC1 family protein
LGDLFGMGSLEMNRLGLNIELVDYLTIPQMFKFFKEKGLKLIEVAMGEAHILALAKKKDGLENEVGSVYTWGLDLFGRLGYLNEFVKNDDEEMPETEDYVFRRKPQCLNIPEPIARIACGKDFSACLTLSGKIYTWGNNKWGNLGHAPDENNMEAITATPQLVRGLEKEFLIQIVCGDKHMMALNKERRIYTWGDGSNGALGHGNYQSISSPQKIYELSYEDIIYISAGHNSSAAINSKGQIYTWGSGQHGKLGHGTIENYPSPKKLTDKKLNNNRFYLITIGNYHTLFSSCILILIQ